MGCVAAVLGNVMFACDDANSASCVAVLDEKLDERLLAEAMSRFLATPNRARAVVVQLTARHFTETAAHFQRVTTPVEWPTDEFDID